MTRTDLVLAALAVVLLIGTLSAALGRRSVFWPLTALLMVLLIWVYASPWPLAQLQ